MSPRVIAPGANTLLPTPYLTLLEQTLAEIAPVHGLVVVDGPPGTGKTTAITHTARATGVPVTYASLGPRPGTAKVLRELLSHFEQVNARLIGDEAARRLRGWLGDKDRILVVDEAQKLARDGVDALVDLHDHYSARFTLVMVGARVRDKLAAFEEFGSRISRVVSFHPLEGEHLFATLAAYHPLLAGTDPDLLADINAQHLHGNLRRWAFFTHAVYERLDDDAIAIDRSTALAALAAMGLVRA